MEKLWELGGFGVKNVVFTEGVSEMISNSILLICCLIDSDSLTTKNKTTKNNALSDVSNKAYFYTKLV